MNPTPMKTPPNPAWAHKQRVLAAQAQAKEEKEVPVTGGKENREFDLLLTSLENDLRRLSGLPKGTARNKVKAKELIPQYRPHIDKYLASGDVYANPVLVQVMIWLFDVGEIDRALSLAVIAAEQKQKLPEAFTRDIPTFAADATLEWAKSIPDSKKSIGEILGSLLSLIDGGGWQVHDEILVKCLRLKADTLEVSDPAASLALLRRILTLDPGAKLKTMMERLQKTIKNQTPPPPAAGA